MIARLRKGGHPPLRVVDGTSTEFGIFGAAVAERPLFQPKCARPRPLREAFLFANFWHQRGPLAKPVDATDLKSVSRKGVPVRVGQGPPFREGTVLTAVVLATAPCCGE